ncbi:hypothetical protein B0J17DRAFT_687613 [Rhizoctonia solani]|nr:hypothetical protein B0J17DRAFT_687613 [Rhizoctonia solani]
MTYIQLVRQQALIFFSGPVLCMPVMETVVSGDAWGHEETSLVSGEFSDFGLKTLPLLSRYLHTRLSRWTNRTYFMVHRGVYHLIPEMTHIEH